MRKTLVLPAALFLFLGLIEAQTVSVLNGASFRVGQPVSAGSWASAFGTFTGITQAVAPAYPFPTTLGGATVRIENINAPLYFVSASQINFLIPTGVEPGLRNVQVQTSGGTFTGTVRVMTTGPGLFVKDNANPPKGAVLNQNSVENTEQAPARRGEVVQVFGTGPGALDNPIPDGAAAPVEPLSRTRSTPQAFIAGVPAQVIFSGMTPGYAGLWQINIVVPLSATFIQGRVPVQIWVDGVESNEVSIFVAQ